MTPEQHIRAFLDQYGQRLTAGDGAALAEMYALPALIVADAGALAVVDRAQITEFFGHAPEQYRAQGIVGTRPEVDRIEPLTDKLFSVDVRWPYVYEDGHEAGGEHSRYLVELGPDRVRIRSVTMRAGLR
jgi:hypothetical protein